MKYKIASILLFFGVIAITAIFSGKIAHAQSGGGSFTYTPMEEIPGYGKPSDFPNYIMNAYKFGLWVVGLCALLMITIGGFMYIGSAGNAASAGKAKGIITDAIIGLALALISYLLLYTINPELVKFTGLSGGGTSGNPGQTSGNPGGPTAQTGLCKVENLQTAFGNNAARASCICNAESGGTEDSPSGEDKCQPGGQTISWGLFQLNISVHDVTSNCSSNIKTGKNQSGQPCSPAGASCAASKHYAGSSENCEPRANYDSCKNAANNGPNNINYAAKLSKGGSDFSQ